MLMPVVSLILWDNYGLDSNMQFVLYSALEVAGLAGSGVFIAVTRHVSAAKIASLTRQVASDQQALKAQL